MDALLRILPVALSAELRNNSPGCDPVPELEFALIVIPSPLWEGITTSRDVDGLVVPTPIAKTSRGFIQARARILRRLTA